MALPFETDSIDAIPEALREHYAEADGKFRLSVEGVVPEAQFKELNQRALTATEEATRRRKANERLLSAIGVDAADKAEAAIAALKAGKGGADQEAIIAQIRGEYEGKLTEANGRAQKLVLRSAEGQASAALAAVGFHPEAMDLVARLAMDRVKLDESGEIRIMAADGEQILAGSGKDGRATFADLAREIAAAKPSFLVDAGKGGTGKPAASGGNAAKTITRAQFDALSQSDRAAFSKARGKVTD